MFRETKKAITMLTAGITIAVALLFFSYPESASGQEIFPPANDRTQIWKIPQARSQTVFTPEFPGPSMPSDEVTLRIRQLREKEAELNRRIDFIRTIESEGLRKGRELNVVSKGRRIQVGHVTRRAAESFTLVDSQTQQENDIHFSEIESLHVVLSASENAKRVAESIGVGALVIATLPLTIFFGLIGWDGC